MLKNNIIYNDFIDWRFDVSRARGSYIWEKNGKKLIDFTSGWNVVNLGWNHPEITKAMINQSHKNTYACMWTADPIQKKLAKLLCNSLPKKLNAVGRATGGTEANEEALKTARAFTGRKKIIGFKESYHGQSFATLALGSLPEWTKEIAPLADKIIQLNFPDIYRTNKNPMAILKIFSESLEKKLIKKDVAAIMTEAGIMTGSGSTLIAPDGFLQVIKKLTKKYGTLLILDEVGTGFSRCGKLFGMHIENITPDIVTFAKGLSNGAAPIGAMVTTSQIARKTYKSTNLTSTFGWTPVACATALKTLQIHKREKVWIKAEKDGKYIKKLLLEKLNNHPHVTNIRGIGLEMGIDFVKDKATNEKCPNLVNKIVKEARKNGLHITSNHENHIVIIPPLTTSRITLNRGLKILVDIIKKY